MAPASSRTGAVTILPARQWLSGQPDTLGGVPTDGVECGARQVPRVEVWATTS